MTALLEFEQALAADSASRHVFRLYVAGATERSSTAISSLRVLFDQYLAGRYELQVVDVYQDPQPVLEDGILAVPALVKCAPLPALRLVGDLSDSGRVLAALGLG